VSLDAGLLTVGVIAAEPRRSALDRERVEKLSHDLRTPLNAVLGYAQLLGLNDLPADQRGSVDQIIAGGRRLLGVIETLEQT
jgi:signal transduction histidine kinase